MPPGPRRRLAEELIGTPERRHEALMGGLRRRQPGAADFFRARPWRQPSARQGARAYI